MERVLIAFDRDEAGDRAAGELAGRLMEEGFGCFRVQFPQGLDANEYALKVKPAAKSLGLLIRTAEWMGTKAGRRSGRIASDRRRKRQRMNARFSPRSSLSCFALPASPAPTAGEVHASSAPVCPTPARTSPQKYRSPRWC